MKPESPVTAELQPLLDALCEETITPEQLRRLEELVLSRPEAESHYIQFMSMQAALIGHIAGLPEPKPELKATPAAQPIAPAVQVPVEPAKKAEEKPTGSWRTNKVIAWSILASLVVGVLAYQGFAWASYSRDVRNAELALNASKARVEELKAEDAAARKATRKDVDAAEAAEAALAKQYLAAHEAARKAIEEKEFTVRVTGPTHIQPGAPNKWQIETLRHGVIRQPKKLDVIVKDAKDKELYRRTHYQPAGAATLELGTAFWSGVEPGTELFLEVVSFDADGKSVLAERLPLARPVFVTHLVTDKPLYKPGETLRFRSLTLDRSSLRPPEHDLHLVFKLRDPANSVIPLEVGNGRLLADLKPVLGPDGKPLRGIGVGEYAIPETAAGGEYKLDLFEVSPDTGKEVLLETRKFIVNRYVPDTFEKKLEFDGKSYGAGENVQARIEVSRTAGGPMVNARANVVAAAEGKNFYEVKDAKFTAITEGGNTRTVLDVRFKLPADIFEKAKDAPNVTLSVSIRDGSDVETFVRPVPLVTKNLRIDFFPEGGELIAGVPGRVYFMVRTPIGKPADVKGVITDGTNTVAEVSTLTDAENPGVNRGHGAFALTPEPGTKYFLKIQTPTGITEPTKDGFPLPVAKPDGISLTALDAVTPKRGTIRVRLQSPTGPKTLHVGAYVRERLIAQQKIVVEASKPVDVSLKGDEAAGGVTRVTVFEEVRSEDLTRVVLVPRAERLVFRGSSEYLALQAKPDKPRYSPSDRVRLDLSAFTEKGTPTPAVLLVGVVNRSAITMADNKNDRLQSTHFLLSGEVKNSADLEHADFLLTDHPKAAVALDLLLGTQGWRRFAEQEAAPPSPADKPDVDQMLLAHGKATSAPVQLIKLEQQRLNAEFAPKLEVARLRTASAEAEWKALPTPFTAQLNAANAEASVDGTRRADAYAALNRYKARFERIGDAVLPLLLILVLVGSVFGGLLAALHATAPKPPPPPRISTAQAQGNDLPPPEVKSSGQERVFLAFMGTLLLCGVFAVAFTTLGKNANSTFSFVGSSIKPPGGPNFFSRSQRAPAEPPSFDRGPAAQPKAFPDAKQPVFDPVSDPSLSNKQFSPKQLKGWEGSQPNQKGPAIAKKESTGVASDKAKVADAFRQPVSGAEANSTLTADRVLVLKNMSAVPITPFVVREYAHYRDPSLGEVRSDFTETVYWHPVLGLPQDGKATVEFQLSDDIARYQILVAGHTLDGRVGAITQTIEARKPFSVDPKLPVEISHTDTIDLPVRVTNDSDVSRTVALNTVLGSGGFKTADKLQDLIELGPNGKGRKMLRLNTTRLDGYAAVLVEGKSGTETDAIARTIRVTPDGFPRVGSYSNILEKGRGRSRVSLPKDVVPGSLRVRLEMYPTPMADLLSGLDGLLREPYGCFEQTSSCNYPNTLILDYMNQTNQTKPEVAKRAKELLGRGYARLMTFECMDTPKKFKHGFEWFGAPDQQHEAITAYGLLQFKDMARVFPVDAEMLRRTQDFLLSRRDGKGGFTRSARTGSRIGYAPAHTTNAYIVWSLVESDPDDADKLDLKTEIAALKAEALDPDSAGGKDAYYVALAANVLLLRNDRETAHKLLDRLKDKHLKDGAVTGAVTSITNSGGRDLEVEATALALLGWMRANDRTYAAAIKESVKWISQQRNGYGAFQSTQSTVLALKALTLHARKNAHPPEGGELRLVVGGKVVGTRTFTEQDADVIGLDIPNPDDMFKPGATVEVEVATDAKHPYPFTLGYTYTTLTPESDAQCAVKIGTKLGKSEANEGDTVPLHVTFENKLNTGHGMAVAIVGIPAGMKVPTDLKQLTDLREKGVIAFFELRGRELILYWRELAPEQKIELTVDLVCDVPGVYRGPASRGYLYYNADHKHWVEPLSVKIAPMSGKE
jgi:hypothetical protein